MDTIHIGKKGGSFRYYYDVFCNARDELHQTPETHMIYETSKWGKAAVRLDMEEGTLIPNCDVCILLAMLNPEDIRD